MNMSETVRALLSMRGKKQSDLVPALEMSSQQSIHNKFAKDRWDGKDLIKVASFLGCRLAFVLPNKDLLYFDSEPYVVASPKTDAVN